MIVVSSFRPFSQCSPAILKNQLRARDSWENNFERIVYFGQKESSLAGGNVEFVASEPFPCIKHMAAKAASFGDWACLINSDIVVGDDFPMVCTRLIHNHAMCAVSKRYEFTAENLEKAAVIDYGLDFFAAKPEVWDRLAREIPEQFRIGHNCWDSYTLGFFNMIYGIRVFDITGTRIIFHPKHEDRKQIHPIDQTVGGIYLEQCGWPRTKMH